MYNLLVENSDKLLQSTGLYQTNYMRDTFGDHYRRSISCTRPRSS